MTNGRRRTKPASQVTLYDFLDAYCEVIKRGLERKAKQSAPADTTAAERSARAASHALGDSA
jgi:hypothetical protein